VSSVSAGIGRIETATGLVRLVGMEVVSLFSGQLWNDFRLNRGHSGPVVRPEGYYTRHVVVVNAGGPTAVEIWSPGMRYTGHRLSPGNVIVYPAGMPYVARWSASKSTVVDIAPEFVRSVAGRDVATKDLEIHPAFAIKDDVVANLAALLGADALAGAPNGSLYGEGLGTALVARLLHRQGGAPPGSGVTVRALSPGDLRRVTAYIDEQLETPLSLQRLADLLGMNLYRFVRAFKESTGVPPYRYVLERRIELSKSLLADSNCSITEVALRTGFASQSHFATAFRRLTSVTPGRYRRDHCHLACSPREAAGSGA